MNLKKSKKGFTLVELIVVIAIVAILAAVSVVSYLAFINQANVSNDTQIVKELNTILQADEALNGPRDTYHEVLEVVGDNGFVVEKLTPRTNGYRIVYDKPHNRFALLNEEDKAVYEDTGSRHYEYVLGEVWNIVNKGETLSDKFANYLGESYDFTGNTVVEITTGLDVGNHTERRDIKYVGQTESQHAIIRTMGGTFTVNNGNDDVTHYGLSTEATVEDVKAGTYKEFGTVGRLYYADDEGGIQLLKKDDSAVFCYMNKTTDENANKVNAAAQNATVYTWVDANAGIASGYATGTGISPVTVNSNNEVSVASCHNHNGEGNYELLRIGDLQYIICKSCGAFALYEGENQTPIAESEEIAQSEEPFDYNPVHLNQTYGFYNSYVDGDHWVHEITHKAEFRNILAHISAKTGTVVDGQDLANKDTVYLLKNNINFGGSLWNDTELSKEFETFTGKLIGEGENKIVLSNIQVYSTVKSPINKYLGNYVSDGWDKMICLFGSTKDAYFENIALSNMVMSNSQGKGCGLFAHGYWGDDGGLNYDGGDLTFENCEVYSNCSVTGKQNLGAFVGTTRCIKNVKLSNCVNNANVLGTSQNVGGFIGTGTIANVNANDDTNPDTIEFEACTNNGRIVGYNTVGGFAGNVSNTVRNLTFKNINTNNGKVYSISGNDMGAFLAKHSWHEVIYEGSSQVNTATLYPANKNAAIKESNGTYNISGIDSLENCPIKLMGLSFSGDNKIVSVSNKPALGQSYKVVSDVSIHIIRTGYDGNEYPGYMGGESYVSIINNESDSFEFAESLSEVTQAGYMVPNGAYGYGTHGATSIDKYQAQTLLITNENKIDGVDYSNGYHYRDAGKSYIVVTNEDSDGITYNTVVTWRLRVRYTITVLDNNNDLVGIATKEVGELTPGQLDPTSIVSITA